MAAPDHSKYLTTVQKADDLAKQFYDTSVVEASQKSLGDLVSQLHKAALLMDLMGEIIKDQWKNSVQKQPEDAESSHIPDAFSMAYSNDKVKVDPFPSFNDWHIKKYSQTFDGLWMRQGMQQDVMLRALSVEIRQYVGELSANLQGIRPEQLDKNLFPYNSDSRSNAGMPTGPLADARHSRG